VILVSTRWIRGCSFDDEHMTARSAQGGLGEELMALYRSALPEVYGFLLARCGSRELAEDLTADAFLSAVTAIRSGAVDAITTGWVVVVAQRRLVDHWRRLEVEQRRLQLVPGAGDDVDDPWAEDLDLGLARTALAELLPQHRAVLTLKYIDGLSVAEVARLMGRSIAATEGLLQRARTGLRRAYEEMQAHDL
jgi:RNA polymerase sigma-70 factor, ECF subfamily